MQCVREICLPLTARFRGTQVTGIQVCLNGMPNDTDPDHVTSKQFVHTERKQVANFALQSARAGACCDCVGPLSTTVATCTAAV